MNISIRFLSVLPRAANKSEREWIGLVGKIRPQQNSRNNPSKLGFATNRRKSIRARILTDLDSAPGQVSRADADVGDTSEVARVLRWNKGGESQFAAVGDGRGERGEEEARAGVGVFFREVSRAVFAPYGKI